MNIVEILKFLDTSSSEGSRIELQCERTPEVSQLHIRSMLHNKSVNFRFVSALFEMTDRYHPPQK